MANIKKPFGKSKNKMISVSLSSEDMQVVKGLSEMEGVSVSSIVRRGIELVRLEIFKR